MQTTVQDYPGRLGYWHVGVPPSGPMDTLAFRLANRLVGNPEARGRPRVHDDRADAALPCGRRDRARRRRHARRDSMARRCRCWRADRRCRPARSCVWAPPPGRARAPTSPSAAASTCPSISAAGRRSSSASSAATPAACCGRATCCAGCDDAGLAAAARASRRARSRATRTSGRSACSTGRTARRTSSPTTTSTRSSPRRGRCTTTPTAPACGSIGPRPTWARKDGGEAGLHPSNLHDNAYAIGAMDFTGDMPILLGPDGPSLGGFVCPAVIAHGRAVEDRPAPRRRHGPLLA